MLVCTRQGTRHREDNNERNETNQDVEDNNATEQQNNGTTLQENVKDQKREDRHTNTPQLGQEESPEDMENSSVGLTDESEADLYANIPALVTDSPDTDPDDTGYKETGDSETFEYCRDVTCWNFVPSGSHGACGGLDYCDGPHM